MITREETSQAEVEIEREKTKQIHLKLELHKIIIQTALNRSFIGNQFVSKERNPTILQTIQAAEFEGLPQVQQTLFTLQQYTFSELF